jgi:hypothetical protein
MMMITFIPGTEIVAVKVLPTVVYSVAQLI